MFFLPFNTTKHRKEANSCKEEGHLYGPCLVVYCPNNMQLISTIKDWQESCKWLYETGKRNNYFINIGCPTDKVLNKKHTKDILQKEQLFVECDTKQFKCKYNGYQTFQKCISESVNESSDKIFFAQALTKNTFDNNSESNIYLYQNHEKKLILYFLSRGTLDKAEMLSKLPELSNWLFQKDPKNIIPVKRKMNEYLFAWIIASIEKHDGNIMAGLHYALTHIRLKRLRGSYSFILYDLSGVYAFTKHSELIEEPEYNLSYRITSDSRDTRCIIIKGSGETIEQGWSILREHCLYHFPSHEDMHMYFLIDSTQFLDIRFKPEYNWEYLTI